MDSDGTIRLAKNFNSPGEKCTLNAIKYYNKPHFDVNLVLPPDFRDVCNWIKSKNIKVLNVAGNHQYKNFDIFSLTVIYLEEVIKLLRK
jgi:hypothetical protein